MSIVADPDQLSLMRQALENCAGADLDRQAEGYYALARRVVYLFESGVRDPEEMARALSEAPAASFTNPAVQRRRVDKDKIERATREAKAVIDAEGLARKVKSARLRKLRLGTSLPTE